MCPGPVSLCKIPARVCTLRGCHWRVSGGAMKALAAVTPPWNSSCTAHTPLLRAKPDSPPQGPVFRRKSFFIAPKTLRSFASLARSVSCESPGYTGRASSCP
ncbi:unnamed protein product [Pleuronectes platessa]|uniref:Uncharacterized protein n=1 Tax=Pleuronectes platessa TaxID=8262 RepID=A0A9N7TU26_PLEPL|nr:unnamed protein product [Pleuronectes platessa]